VDKKNQKLKALGLIIVGALSNWLIRGGGIKKWFPNVRFTKVIHALLFSVIAFCILNDWRFAAISSIAMLIGQSPALFHESTDDYLKSINVLGWSLVVLLRGLVWQAPIIATCVYWQGLGAAWQIIPAFLMPLAYSPNWFMKNEYWAFNKWTVSEILFGIVQISCFVLLGAK
jgi:hypothetical protein